MIKNKTVIVVGAGASAEFGLPTGDELKNHIVDILSPDEPIIYDAAIKYIQNNINTLDYRQFRDGCKLIYDALKFSISIDNLIHAHSGNKGVEVAGKLGIAKSILKSENNSHIQILKHNNKFRNSLHINSWLTRIFNKLTEGVQKNDLESIDIFENIKFITFNYDRCIEHYLYHCIKMYFNLDEKSTFNILKHMKIIHVYGQIGKLDWQSPRECIPYGYDGHGIETTIENIKTFTEGVENHDFINQITEWLNECENLIFIGFAFHNLNMELLQRTSDEELKNIFATTLGMSQNDVNIIVSQLHQFSHTTGLPETNYILDRMTGSEFINHYYKSIT